MFQNTRHRSNGIDLTLFLVADLEREEGQNDSEPPPPISKIRTKIDTEMSIPFARLV